MNDTTNRNSRAAWALAALAVIIAAMLIALPAEAQTRRPYRTTPAPVSSVTPVATRYTRYVRPTRTTRYVRPVYPTRRPTPSR